MKVIVISHMYPNVAQPLSGIFVQKQIEALAAQGAEVTLVNPSSWFPAMLKGLGAWGRYARVPHCDVHKGIEVYHPRVVELPKGYFFNHYPQTYRLGMAKLMDRLIKEKKPDLIHAHVAHPDGAAAAAFGEKYNLPVVITVHGQDFAHTLKRSPKSAEIVKDTLRRADRVILVSDKLKQNYGLEQWADDLDKFKIIYNGVNLEEVSGYSGVHEEDQYEEDQYKENQYEENEYDENQLRSPVLLTVGFLRQPKGHVYVLRALAESSLLKVYPNLVYRIVGDGAERENLEEKVRELGLKNHVEFLGELPYPEAMREMAKCDIFVMPSWNEAFGVVYLEALAHGKPVIGTKGEGIAPLLEKEEVGLTVRPRNSEDISLALETLLSHPEQARAMGAKGRELVYDRFTWEQNARETIKVYQECLADLHWKSAK